LVNDPLQIHISNTIPLASSGEATVCTFEVPISVLIIDIGSQEEFAMVLLDAAEDTIDDIVQYAISGWRMLRHDRDFSLWTGDNSDAIEWFISIDRVRRLRFFDSVRMPDTDWVAC
jgi:hypothetical protein